METDDDDVAIAHKLNEYAILLSLFGDARYYNIVCIYMYVLCVHVCMCALIHMWIYVTYRISACVFMKSV